jgi:hypothetical protein
MLYLHTLFSVSVSYYIHAYTTISLCIDGVPYILYYIAIGRAYLATVQSERILKSAVFECVYALILLKDTGHDIVLLLPGPKIVELV